MKHVVMTGPKTSVVADMPDVELGANQILIRNRYVGVCMSEHYDWAHAKAGDAFGHEPMGVVTEVGKDVTGFAVGDRVGGSWGGSLPGSGGMVEFAAADPARDIVVKIPDNVRDEDAILEPLSCMMSAVSKVRFTMPGTVVCVVGAGYMGCGLISLLKLRGAYVAAVDIRPESLANAKKFGADETYSVEEALAKFSAHPYGGFDYVMEWGETNESLDEAINLTNECGHLYVGAYHTGPKRLVDMQQLGVKAIDLWNTPPREWNLSNTGAHNAVKLLSSGEWKFSHVPTKVYPMGQFDLAHAEEETKYGKYMKALIDMTKLDGEARILEA
ncbi:MAG: zinc-binding dehydrogenase [Defluviitaleaceae bacterium]|nr:zinc-binding dehydrogenase [Defluviitaleaceae bacterium]